MNCHFDRFLLSIVFFFIRFGWFIIGFSSFFPLKEKNIKCTTVTTVERRRKKRWRVTMSSTCWAGRLVVYRFQPVSPLLPIGHPLVFFSTHHLLRSFIFFCRKRSLSSYLLFFCLPYANLPHLSQPSTPDMLEGKKGGKKREGGREFNRVSPCRLFFPSTGSTYKHENQQAKDN